MLAAAFAMAACSGSEGTAPAKPTAVQAVSGSGASATVGTALASSPTFKVTDASGNAVANVAVTIAVTGGGGSLSGAPTKSSSGATSVGTWTLGTTAGTNTITVTVAGLTPLTITATGTAASASKVTAAPSNVATAKAGDVIASPVVFAVQDQYGNGVANQPVTFTVTAGGGSVTPSTATTDASGNASTTWRLGNRGGTQTLSAVSGTFSTTFTATIQSSFVLDLRWFPGAPPMSAQAQAAFTSAAARIRAAIVGQISTVSLAGADLGACGIPELVGTTLQETTTGVIIYAGVAAIDGIGKVLAQAGPCYVRNSSILPAVGVMKFDDADIQNYINTGRFEALVLHEMNHVVGFGTIWPDKNLLQNPAFTNDENPVATGSMDPRFTGTVALAQCLSLPGVGASHCAAGVAVEQCGTAGTADGHWREIFTTTCTGTNNSPQGGSPAFDSELMTGYVEGTSNMPWSTMSLAQYTDLGYTVNLLAADSYAAPNLLAMARLRAAAEAAGAERAQEVLLRPRFTVGGGRIQAIRREARR
jgi:hypothetical protein